MKKPNMLFILADDLGWNDLGADGSRFHESPNLDRLASEGMRFTQAYANCQVCSPSRASILTGQYPTRHGITDWIGAPSGEDWRNAGRHTKLLPADYAHSMNPATKTLADILLSAGYRTFFAGKWHLGDGESCPENFGFEINKGGWHAGSPIGGYFAPWINPKLAPGKPGESLPIRLANETAQFISDNRDAPFLAYLSFYSVHGPLETSRDRWEKFRRKAVAQGAPDKRFIFDRRLPVRQIQDCPIYAGMIEAMDDAVGIVLRKLDELGLTDDTIVVFTSDNGGVSSGDSYSSSMLPLRGGKGRQWEGGIREPLYIRFPRAIKPGTTCGTPVTAVDFLPTLLGFAGVEPPAGQITDGLSLQNLLQGKRDPALSDRDIFWHYPHYGNQGGDPSSIIRNGNWKLIHYYEDGHDELYDLSTDPGEQHNCISGHTDMAAAMRARLDNWLTETEAKLPLPDPLYDPSKEADYLQKQKTELMEALEKQHALYLDPDWEPNPDWWGSQQTID